MQTAEERRAVRERTWVFEKKTVQDDEPDTSHLSVSERFALVWQITPDAWAFTGEPIGEPGSSQHIGVLRRAVRSRGSFARRSVTRV